MLGAADIEDYKVKALINISAPEKHGHKRKAHHHKHPKNDICSLTASSVVALPMKHKCAPACPFSQKLPGDQCHKVCVAEGTCAKFHPGRGFADPESKQCINACGRKPKDIIAGCSRCAGVGLCSECMRGFTLRANGTKCQNVMEGVWPIIYIIIGSVFAILAYYTVNLVRRPTVNSEVCERSLQFRDHCKTWRIAADKSWHPYPIIQTDVRKTNISGQGVILYFRRLSFAIGAALLLFLTSCITYQVSSFKIYQDQAQAFTDCSRAAAAEATHQIQKRAEHKQEAMLSYSQYMFFSMLMAYLVLLVASLVFEYTQARFSETIDDLNATHEDYALRLRGLPKDCTDPNEIKDFFQQFLDAAGGEEQHRIVGCSIAYDYKEHEDLINNAITEWVEELEIEHERKHMKHKSGVSLREEQKKEISMPKSHSQNGNRACFSAASSIARLEFLDFLFWGSCSDADDDAGTVYEKEVTKVLKDLQGSGFCYVIVEMPATLDFLKEQVALKGPMFRDKHKIGLHDVASEPPDLYWQNYTNMNFWPRIIFGIFLIALTIGLWVMMYMPYATYTGTRTSFMEGTLLGLIITLGNAIVAQVIDVVTRWAGFCHKDRRDMAILSLALLATLLNTVFDLWMILRIAKGVNGSESDKEGGTSQGFDHVVAQEMFAMIVPGYLILPYVVTPVVEHVIPYWLGLWLVRSRKASLRDGEEYLKCPEFDICWRYSDLHNNFTVCTLMLFLTSSLSYQVMMWLLAFLLLVNCIDKYKLLRATSQTFYSTRRLSTAAALWWCIPTAMLATVTSWWACRADILPSTNWHLTCSLVFVVHCTMWVCLCCLMQWCAKSKGVVETTSYNTMCESLRDDGIMWSYFNTNPIYCLRSKYLDLKEPGSSTFPCVPYVSGRQHLQPGASDNFDKRNSLTSADMSHLSGTFRTT